jgi:hypothetical protein
MAELRNVRAGTGINRSARLRAMYGETIPYGNCKGPTYSPSGSEELRQMAQMRLEEVEPRLKAAGWQRVKYHVTPGGVVREVVG